jgi:hypothetical protein
MLSHTLGATPVGSGDASCQALSRGRVLARGLWVSEWLLELHRPSLSLSVCLSLSLSLSLSSTYSFPLILSPTILALECPMTTVFPGLV